MSMKNPNDTIENQTHDLLVCSAVFQPTAPHVPPSNCGLKMIYSMVHSLRKLVQTLAHFLNQFVFSTFRH
jgi:hypothetical protein